MTSDAETQEAQFEYDRDAVGVDVDLGEFTLSPEQVKKYCEAMGETNPLFASGEVAPPGILSSVSFGRSGLDAKVQFGNTTFMAGSRMEFFAPIKANETLHVRSKIKEVFGKTGRSGTMVFVVRRTEFVDTGGGVVAAIEQSQVHREVEAAS
jgi:acyl dehydratase